MPLTFRHPWSSSSFSWLTRPGFLQMDGRVWLQGLSFHLPSCRAERGVALSPSDSLGDVPPLSIPKDDEMDPSHPNGLDELG